jgi:hypothetical protein
MTTCNSPRQTPPPASTPTSSPVTSLRRTVRTNPAYRFASERAQRTSDKYGAHTIELLAAKSTEEISK